MSWSSPPNPEMKSVASSLPLSERPANTRPAAHPSVLSHNSSTICRSSSDDSRRSAASAASKRRSVARISVS